MFALFAVEALLGRKLAEAEYLPTEVPAVRKRKVALLLRTLK